MKFAQRLLLILGCLLLVLLVITIGPRTLLHHIRTLGWFLPFVLLPYALVYLFDTWGWRCSLESPESPVPFPTLFRIRLAGEAINYLTPTAYLGGEPVKTYLLQEQGVPLPAGVASVIIGKSLMTLAEGFFILGGIGLALLHLPFSHVLLQGSLIAVGVVFILLALIFWIQQKGVTTALLRLSRLIGFWSRSLQNHQDHLASLDTLLTRFYRERKGHLALALGFYLLGWAVGSLEVMLILFLLGYRVDLGTALAIEALSVAAKGAAFFVPGSLGFQEGGQVLIFLAFGLPAEVGLTFGIIRRLREFGWAGLGLLSLSRGGGSQLPRPGATPRAS